MRTTLDALRSLTKYTGESILDAVVWETRLAIEEGTFRRPFCRVGLAGPTQYSGPSYHQDAIQPCTLHLFPTPQPNPELALMAALAIEEGLYQGFLVGRDLGRARRIPLWDFDGVDLDHTSTKRSYCDYLRINDLSVGRRVDPENEQNVVVTADIRVNWRRRADAPGWNKVLREIRTAPVTPPVGP
jgi:hypothetical protein